MKVYEFGTRHKKIFVMFQCAAEPWWVFKDSAEAMSRDYHVFLVIADGHDEMGTTFVSIEKNVSAGNEQPVRQHVGPDDKEDIRED